MIYTVAQPFFSTLVMLPRGVRTLPANAVEPLVGYMRVA